MALCLMKGCDSTAAPSSNVCDPCWKDRTAQLRQIPELWLRLQGMLPKGSQEPTDGSAHAPPGPSLPLQICVLDALRALPLDLMAQANIALDMRGQMPLSLAGKRWSYLITQATSVLDAVDDVFYGQPQQLAYATTVAFCHRKALHLTGLDQRVTHLPAPCPACQCHTLYRHHQRRQILCTRGVCRGQWTEAAYAEHVVACVSQA